MLTLNSRFTNFSKRPNAVVTAADLDLLKNIISTDLVNFRGNISYGFTEGIATKIVSRIKVLKDAKICVVNDTSFHMTLKLIEAGYDPANIYIAVGKWKVAGKRIVPDKNDSTLKILKRHAEASFAETLNIISLEDMFNLKFNLIIANPPYGKIGAQITETITKSAEFDEFINLLPIKDMPSAGLEACSHIDMPETIVCAPHSFSDADILTHILRITKTPNKIYSTFEELCADSYFIDKPMVKFMRANVLAKHYAIDDIKMWTSTVDVTRSFIYQLLRTQSQHTCGMDQLDSATVANAYNFDDNVVTEKTSVYKNTICTVAGNSNYKTFIFNTPEEKHNFVAFYKTNRNFINRMIANQFITIRNDAACFPKVDWTRDDWTIEKILKTVAGYTDEEVQAVLDTMDKDYAVKDDASIERLFGEYLKV